METTMMERLEAATALLERTMNLLEERQSLMTSEVERISAAVEQSKREAELTEKLATAEREIEELKAAATSPVGNLRRTTNTVSVDMLAKHDGGDGGVDVRALDAALAGLGLEQRIAVKTQLLRQGAGKTS